MSRKLSASLIGLVLIVTSSGHSQNSDDVTITGTKITDNLYMLQGRGGNLGLFFGNNGVFLIDDQFAPLHDKIMAEVGRITQNIVPEDANMFVINTHYHGDHTGGNELMGRTGAVIVAHENVRKRLSTEQFNSFFNRTTPPSPEGALPVVTFTTDIGFHLNGDSINVIHVGPAHTDGDAIIHFTKANVIHAGDILFTASYPLVDIDAGGKVSGYFSAIDRILSLCDDQTKIIPGHGELTDKANLLRILTMLKTIYERVSKLYAEGKTLEQIQAAKPTSDYDDDYRGFISGDNFVGFIYKELSITETGSAQGK